MMAIQLQAVITCLVMLSIMTVARADTFWIRSAPGGKPIQVSSIKITGLEKGLLLYRSRSGASSDRAIETIAQLQLDDELALNNAEQAFVAGNWDAAVDNYLKSLRSTNKPWLKAWISKRLGEAAGKANRFDAAVIAYLDSILQDPTAALASKPALPDASSSYLGTAVAEVNSALANPKLTDPQRQVMLSFLLDLHRAQKNEKAVAETLAEIMKLSEASGGDTGANAAQLARLKLDLAGVAIDSKQYQKAIDEITSNQSIFIEPTDRADALFHLAEAKHGLAGAGNDPAALKDAAIAYMRVVAHFEETQAKPHVAESLFKTASILESLKEAESAARLYEQVAAQFNDTPFGRQATEALQRLTATPSTQPAS